MKVKNNTIHRIVKLSIILSILFCSILFSAIAASADDIGYYWDQTAGVSIAGYTTDWSSCSGVQTGFRVTSIGSTASSCSNSELKKNKSELGDMFLEIFPTTYLSNTWVEGINATFWLKRSGGTDIYTYRIDLGYAKGGAFTSFGSVTRRLTSSSNNVETTILNTINGTAPAGSNLALKLSVTIVPSGQYAQVKLGTNGGSSGSNSGRFYVSETAATPSTLTYDVTVTPSPASANVAAGGSSVYTIRVDNTGNTNGNFNLVVSDSNSANFQTSTLGTSSLAVPAGGSNQTTLTVTAKAGATTGASDITTVTATSVQNSSYTGSAQVTTNVVRIIPAHTFDTRATDGTTTFATTPNPRTLSYTAGTGSTVMVLNIFTTTTTARAGGAPTFNGKTFTQVGTRQQTAGSTPEGAVEMWYLLLTPSDTGSAHTVSVPNTGSRLMRIHVSTYKSTTGASALDVFAQRPNTGNSQANPSQSITTTANGDVLVDALFDGLSSVPSANNHTLLYKQLAASSYSANSQYYLQPTAGAQSLSWTAAADDFALITASFKAVETLSSYDVTVTPFPASANVAAGGSSVYTIRVDNTGNTNGNYNLAVSDSNSANFQTSTLGTSSLAVPARGSNQTTLTVTAKAGATTGTLDNTTVTVISVENSAYSNSTRVETTVVIVPRYDVSIRASPISSDINPGNSYLYNITVNNTGNTKGNYTLSVTDTDTVYFTGSILGNTTMQINSGGSAMTTLNVTAKSSATTGALDNTTVTVTSFENPAYTNSTRVQTTVASIPKYNVSISASPASTGIYAGNYNIYNITINNTGNTNGNYTLSVIDTDTVNFTGSNLGITTMQINSGGSAMTTLNVTAKSSATTGALDNTTVTVTSVENSAYSNSTSVLTSIASVPSYDVSIRASPTSRDITPGNSYQYNITINNTGNTNGNYTLNVIDSDTVNFTSSTLGNTILQINSGGSAMMTLNVTARTSAITGALDNTTVTVTSVENSAYSNFTMVQTTDSAPSYNVSISASPRSFIIIAGNSYLYNIIVNNTGNTNGNYTLSVIDSDPVNFTSSTLGITTMQINSGWSAMTTLNVTARTSATTGAIDNTIVSIISVENSAYNNSTGVQTSVLVQGPNCLYCHAGAE